MSLFQDSEVNPLLAENKQILLAIKKKTRGSDVTTQSTWSYNFKHYKCNYFYFEILGPLQRPFPISYLFSKTFMDFLASNNSNNLGKKLGQLLFQVFASLSSAYLNSQL